MTGRGILDADMRTVGAWIAQAARWWATQMAAMLPQGVKHAMRPHAVPVAWDPVRGLAEAPPRTRWSALVDPQHVLVREAVLPQLAPRVRAQLVAMEADRLMPFGAGPHVITAEPLAAPVGGRQRLAVVGMVPATAQALAAALRSAPVLPSAVVVLLDPVGEVDLLPSLVRCGLLPDETAVARRWWTAVAALFALNLALIAWRDAAAVEALETAVADQQPALLVARQMSARIRRADRVSDDVARERARAEPLALMGRVAQALPAGVWLQRWGWQGDTLHLAGMRPATADVSGALRRAGLPTVRYADSTGETSSAASGADSAATPLGIPFDIVVRIEARP